MTSALAKLAAFAVSMISFALAFKYANFQNWEIYAFIGGAVLFFVILAIIGSVFGLDLVPSVLVSAIITAFIMVFVSPTFAFIMILIFFGLIMLVLASVEG